MKSGDLSFEEMLSLTSFKNNPIFLIETIFLLLNPDFAIGYSWYKLIL